MTLSKGMGYPNYRDSIYVLVDFNIKRGHNIMPRPRYLKRRGGSKKEFLPHPPPKKIIGIFSFFDDIYGVLFFWVFCPFREKL